MTIASLVKSKILRMGMSGPDVKELQLALAKLGYPLKGTGYFGTSTDTAVETFQRKAGLDPDGDVGTSTAQAIDKVLGAPKPGTGVLASAAPIPRPLWLDYSIAHIGTKEVPGSGNNKELVADIHSVAPDYQMDSTPWCAGWVSLCLVKAEQKPSKQPLWARSYAEGWGVKLSGPALGAIAVKTRTGGAHVTFVAGRNKNGMLACCGGNQGDMVNVSEYAPSAFNLGFFWPKGTVLPQMIGINLLPIVSSNGKAAKET